MSNPNRVARLPEPTICDMRCFKPPGHAGPHQKWLGDSCDREGCDGQCSVKVGTEYLCTSCAGTPRQLEPREELLIAKGENERLNRALRKLARLTNRQIADAPWDVKTIVREALRG